MERIVEPELMDEEAQALAYAEGDFAEPHGRFVTLLGEHFGAIDPGGYVLDLGCGPGDVTVRFAQAYPTCTVHGIDGSAAMLRHGRKILAGAGEAGRRIELILGRLPDDRPPRPAYDCIISNSLLHHLHQPQVLWEAVRRFAASGAPVFVMDLKRPKSIFEARKLVEAYASSEPEVLQRDFYNSLLAAFTVDEIEAQLRAASLEHLAVQEVSDRHLLIAGRMR